MGVKCFYVEFNNFALVSLRRYSAGNPDAANNSCSGPYGYHNARVPYKLIPAGINKERGHYDYLEIVQRPDNKSELWNPVNKCKYCDYQFTEQDEYQVFHEIQYICKADSTIHYLAEHTPGMMWDSWWYRRTPEPKPGLVYCGPDGLTLTVYCPDGGQWTIDGRASNCTLPKDNEHRCWVRHGVPPMITVDKNGHTCDAGAGSIISPNGNYHGFLQNGEFT